MSKKGERKSEQEHTERKKKHLKPIKKKPGRKKENNQGDKDWENKKSKRTRKWTTQKN